MEFHSTLKLAYLYMLFKVNDSEPVPIIVQWLEGTQHYFDINLPPVLLEGRTVSLLALPHFQQQGGTLASTHYKSL